MLDIEEGRVPFRLFLQAMAYSEVKTRTTPFLEEQAQKDAQRKVASRKRLKDVQKQPLPRKKPLAKKVEM